MQLLGSKSDGSKSDGPRSGGAARPRPAAGRPAPDGGDFEQSEPDYDGSQESPQGHSGSSVGADDDIPF